MAFKFNNFRSQAEKVFWITIGWTFISEFVIFLVHANMIGLNLDISHLDYWLFYRVGLLTGVLAGLIGGTAMVVFWEKWLRTKNYGWCLWNIWWTYTVIYIIVGIPTGLITESGILGLPAFHPKVYETVYHDFFSLPGLQSYLLWLFVVLGTLVLLLVNDKYGPGVFVDFLLGKYFHPKREERIFMFLDLRSSTTIAEKLGEENYFTFLKEVFNLATPSILNSGGEIYQYVGDEIVVSWKVNQGVENANCIHCFFEIQKAVNERRAYFESKFGVVPVFKAGLHYGHVMAGEIGLVKRDIAFSGDVLNTTARIQSKCNELGVDILLSKYLLDRMRLSAGFNLKEMGNMELRGKQQKMMLYTV